MRMIECLRCTLFMVLYFDIQNVWLLKDPVVGNFHATPVNNPRLTLIIQ